MRPYEFTCIYRADLPEGEISKTIEKYEKLFVRHGGQIVNKDVWGTKKLAYPINKQFRGHYVCYDLNGEQKDMLEVERLMNIDDNVLRYLSIHVSKHTDPLKKESFKEQFRDHKRRNK